MHPKVEAAIQEIDAAVMNGDTFFDDEAREAFREYLASWLRELDGIDEMEPFEDDE